MENYFYYEKYWYNSNNCQSSVGIRHMPDAMLSPFHTSDDLILIASRHRNSH